MLIAAVMDDGLAANEVEGKSRNSEDLSGVYVEALVQAFIKTGQTSLDGLSVVADCANGAAHETFPKALRALGVEPILIGVLPDGRNINEGCGSTHPGPLSEAVKVQGADVGHCAGRRCGPIDHGRWSRRCR